MFKNKVSCLLFFFSIFIVFSFAPKTFAFTTVTDDIVEDTTWTKNQGPYIVADFIAVMPGATLTIEPGVVVKFDYNNGLYILGSIEVNGTSLEKISFSSLYDSIGADLYNDCLEYIPDIIPEEGIDQCANTNQDEIDFPWLFEAGEITVFDTLDSSFHNVLFSHLADNGLSFFNASAILDNVQILDSSVGIQTHNSNLGIFNSIFRNIYNTDALELYQNSDAKILNIKVESSDYGGLALYGSKADIADSTFAGNGETGIETYSRVGEIYQSELNASGLKISGYDSGLAFYGGTVYVEQTKLFQNYIGFEVYSSPNVTVVESSITGNAYASSVYSSNMVNAVNNYWGDSSGPFEINLNPGGLGGEIQSNSNIIFTPWLTSDPLVECCSSVLFLPGIEASRLYKQKTILDLPVEDQLWEPNGNSDVEDLYLNTDGTSKNFNIYTRDIIQESNTPIPTGLAGQNIYKSFVNMLSDLIDDFKITDYKLFAYDWRQSVEDIVNNDTKYQDENVSLVDTLQSLVDSSKSGKVTIVAHSNGGLLAKALLQKLQDDKNAGKNNLIDKVDVLILVAVPEIGTAKAVPAILHGYDLSILGGWLMDETHTRELGRNMLSAFGLLPSKEYINRVSASPVTFVDYALPSNITTKLVQAFGSAIDSYTEYKNFLFGEEGRTDPIPNQTKLPIILSQDLFSQAENLHDNIDAWIPPASMRVIEVAGWGLDDSCPVCASFVLDERPRFTSDGDKTVVVPSAHYMSVDGKAEKYWVDLPEHNHELGKLRRNRNHGDILEIAQLNNLISSVIKKEAPTYDLVLMNTKPIDTSNRLRLSIHSPVTLDAYDTEGNHTGKICPPTSDFCYVEENILNSSYLEFGEGKYINLPEDQMSKVKLQGIDVGTFTYESEKVLPDGTSTISSFVDIPVTTQTQAEITLNSNTQILELKLDVTGDGITDFTLTPSATFDPITYLKIMKVTIDSLDLNKGQIRAFDNRVDNIIKLIQKGRIDKAKLKAEKFKIALKKKLSKPDPKHPKPKKLSKTDAQLLLDMLNKLLDNIS